MTFRIARHMLHRSLHVVILTNKPSEASDLTAESWMKLSSRRVVSSPLHVSSMARVRRNPRHLILAHAFFGRIHGPLSHRSPDRAHLKRFNRYEARSTAPPAAMVGFSWPTEYCYDHEGLSKRITSLSLKGAERKQEAVKKFLP